MLPRAALLVVLTLCVGGFASAATYWSLAAGNFTTTCKPRTSSFSYVFSLESTAPGTASAVVLQLGKSWNISGIAHDSTTNITGLRFSLNSLSPGSNKTLSFKGLGTTYENDVPMTYAVVMSDGTVRYGYLRTGGPWPHSDTQSASSVTMNMTIYDFGIGSNDKYNADFERTTGTFTSSERNISSLTLLSDRVPNYYHCYPSTSCTSVSSNTTFQQWFRSVSGVNKVFYRSIKFSEISDGLYYYNNQSFFPIDGVGYGNEGTGSDNKQHNFGFCMAFHGSFQYRVGDVFSFTGDDDVWAYIDNKRVIDLGGIHTAESASVDLDTLSLTPGESYNFDFFYCERHTSQSTFAATTTLTWGECGVDTCGYCINSCATSDGGNDTDGDGYWDCMDACPYDASKRFPGECGCGQKETCAAALADESSSVAPTVVEESSSAVISSSSAPVSTPATESSEEVIISSSPVVQASSSVPVSQATATSVSAAVIIVATVVASFLSN